MSPSASIIVITHNRRDELERALHSCLLQQGKNEIIVVDDASSDGSAAMVERLFPTVRLIRDEVSRGYIVQRNRAARLASGEFLFSIDDDAEFSSPTIVQETLADFSASPRIAAVAIPYTEPPQHDRDFQRAPDPLSCWITGQFIGTAYAIRRETFLDLGGFDEAFIHQGEERDLCIRLLQAGSYVRLGNSAPIRHHCSPSRDLQRMAFYGRRNDVLFSWKHIPIPQVIARLAGTTIMGLFHGLRTHTLLTTLRGIAAGYRGILYEVKRHPVSRATYSLYRGLRTKPVKLNDEWIAGPQK